MLTNATFSQLNEALRHLNKRYSGNISFNNLTQETKNRVRFTLKAKSGEPGSRLSTSGRRLPKASWHAHGYFFDALFALDPNIWVKSRGHKITKDAGNWEDFNVGSIMFPSPMSAGSIEKTNYSVNEKGEFI